MSGKEYVKANVQDEARAIVLATERYGMQQPDGQPGGCWMCLDGKMGAEFTLSAMN
ncbi:MAG: hypothetical protein J5U17_04230 [Candidatus Methanoperedens sp.]|nr:hypothetical protein [Candidatus Methanoperedens sp.]MCE8429712.1 hypothetical protein [Candidatus Methanoperedens sp.]